MTRKAHEMTDEQYHLEERRKYHAAIVSALAEKAGRLAQGVQTKKPNKRKIDEATREIWAMQNTLPGALVELYNSLALEYDTAKK